MSKNQPRVKARDGKYGRWNLFRRTNSKRSFLLPAAVLLFNGRSGEIPGCWGGGAVGLTGLEPVTLRLSSACSNQLSYRPWVDSAGGRAAMVEARGFEPLTYSLQSYRSTN